MSMGRKERINCPKCQNSGSFVIWEIIDTAEEEKNMKEQVMSGEAFLFECPFCKNKVNVDYGLLYHQIEDMLMIQYAQTDEAVQEGIESFAFMKSGQLPGFELADDYRFRVVRSQNEIREKILINDCGLDDRAIELMKIFMLSEIQQTTPNLQYKDFLFDTDEEGKPCFLLRTMDGQNGTIDFIQEVYDSIKEQFVVELKEDESVVVDLNWAMSILDAGQGDGMTS